jgi:hypothetical protein
VSAAESVMRGLRREYHRKLCENILFYDATADMYNNADKGNPYSKAISKRMALKMGDSFSISAPKGQTAGSSFGLYTMEYLQAAFTHLAHLRPGRWQFSAAQARRGISIYDQYEHLNTLKRILDEHNEVKAAFGGDYFITPDIVVARVPVSDAEINSSELLVDGSEIVANGTPLRAANYASPRAILHASISCKWTIRSDRVQNTRTEALNLFRNRKGNAPHIVAVTLEPLPSRLASIAMGTGDVDCTYHGALYELLESVSESGNSEPLDTLRILVEGRRLRDISDLPFDLAI